MITTKIENFAGHMILTSGWRRHAYASIAGGTSALAMPPFDFPLILFFTFPCLIWLLDGVASEPLEGLIKSRLIWFLPGFWFGFGYFLAGMWWVGNALLVESDEFAWALPLAVLILPAILASFFGLATGLAGLAWRDGTQRLFIVAACFTIAEFLRGHVATGLPWNAIAYAAYVSPVLMQSASVIGLYTMTAFAVFCFSVPAVYLPGSTQKHVTKIFTIGLAILFVGTHLGFGYFRLATKPVVEDNGVTIRVVQPAINQAEKWLPEKESEIFNRYLTLSTSPVEGGQSGLSGTDYLVWPESAFPFLLTERRDALAAISAMLPDGTELITGGVRVEPAIAGQRSGYVFNSVMVVNSQGEITSSSDKVHLVPFGEYLPFQNTLEAFGLEQLTRVNGGFTPGASRNPIELADGKSFLPLICYEVIFSGDIVTSEARPDWIANLTNDAWFGFTPGPYQHLRQAVLRAVEEGIPIVRAANTGISAVIDPYGQIVARLPLGHEGVIETVLPPTVDNTFFSEYGALGIPVVVLGFLFIGLFPLRKS